MLYFILSIVVVGIIYTCWKLTSRDAYESAEYTVITSESPFEIRQYPKLTLATTAMNGQASGNDGSFGRLFSYISGNNETQQKISMTTPVFMDMDEEQGNGRMGFVLPKELTQQTVPHPNSERVVLVDRSGGRYAVYRFTGRINQESISQAEQKLRSWIEQRGLTGKVKSEVAGYDPPWTPGPFRRNEILIELTE